MEYSVFLWKLQLQYAPTSIFTTEKGIHSINTTVIVDVVLLYIEGCYKVLNAKVNYFYTG